MQRMVLVQAHMYCVLLPMYYRGEARCGGGGGHRERSGSSSQLGGETLYWSFGKMGAPLYRQTGHSLSAPAYAAPSRQAGRQAAHVYQD